MSWTKEQPTEPGFYWYKKLNGEVVPVYPIMRDGKVYGFDVLGVNGVCFVLVGEFWDEPIAEPGCTVDPKRAAWNRTQDAHDGKLYPPDAKKFRAILLHSRDLAVAVTRCSPEEAKRNYNYLERDAWDVLKALDDVEDTK